MNNNDRIGDARKALIPAFVAVVVLIGLVVSATWAYFTVGISGSATKTTASASTPEVPLVTLSGNGVSLSMNLSAADMAGSSSTTKTYYASESGRVDTQSTPPTIGTLSLSNDTKNTYTCSYTITAKALTKKSLIEAYSEKSTNTGELILKLNNQTFDLATADNNSKITSASGLTANGTIDVKPNGPTNLTAQFSLTNNTKDQSYIADKEATIDITAVITNCNLKTS